MFSVDVKGLDALRKIDGKGAREAIQNAAKGIGASGVAQAKLLSPVDTGTLRSSINFKVSTGNVDADEVAIGSKVFYAPYQELGWGPSARTTYQRTEDSINRRTTYRKGYAGKKYLWGAIFPEFRQTVFNHIIQKFVGKYWESVGK